MLVRVHNVSRQIQNVCLKARKIWSSKFRRTVLLILMWRDLPYSCLLIPEGNYCFLNNGINSEPQCQGACWLQLFGLYYSVGPGKKDCLCK